MSIIPIYATSSCREFVLVPVWCVPEGIFRSACHMAMLISIIHPPDGSYSQLMVGTHGKEDRDPTADEWWKAWVMMAPKIAEMPGLGPNKARLYAEVWKAVCEAMGRV